MSKYLYHLPFHLQLALYKLEGIKISASTVNDWFVGCVDLLRALYYMLREIVLQSDYIQVDKRIYRTWNSTISGENCFF